MWGRRRGRTVVMLGMLWSVSAPVVRAQEGYDPLTASGARAEPIDLVVKDAPRDRAIPLWVYLPSAAAPAPVVLFSHGLGGSRRGSRFLGTHWAARGYVAVFLQHPGSDDTVWRDAPNGGRRAALEKAASLENFRLRVQDVPAVLDQLTAWNGTDGHALAERLDMTKVGMSGHSFGANTTQAVSGQRFPAGMKFTDPRIKSAVIMSPSGPRGLFPPERAFGEVAIPWLLMTGTADNAPIGGLTPTSRRVVYPALPAGRKYELVLHDAEHSAFTDRALPGDALPRNPNHHRAILALSTAFWDATLKGDTQAQTWLDGDGPRSVLEAQDELSHK